MKWMKIITILLSIALAAPALAAKENRVDQLRDMADQQYQEEDWSRALKSYNQLAEYGDKFAQYRLSVMHLEGLGTREDVIEAYAWSALAAETENENLRNYQDTLWQLVPAEHHKKAKSRAKKLSGRYGDLAIARKNHRQATRQLRSCTGSRLGSSCEFVQYSSGGPGSIASGGNTRLPAFEAEAQPVSSQEPGGLPGQDGIVNANTAAAGRLAGGETRSDYYMNLRQSLRAFNRVIDDRVSGRVELGELEVQQDDES